MRASLEMVDSCHSHMSDFHPANHLFLTHNVVGRSSLTWQTATLTRRIPVKLFATFFISVFLSFKCHTHIEVVYHIFRRENFILKWKAWCNGNPGESEAHISAEASAGSEIFCTDKMSRPFLLFLRWSLLAVFTSSLTWHRKLEGTN